MVRNHLAARRMRPRPRLVAVVLALALAAAACGNSGDDAPAGGGGGAEGRDRGQTAAAVPGVSDDEIRFAAFGTSTNNPTGACILDCYVSGIEAYFAFRNSEGGV